MVHYLTLRFEGGGLNTTAKNGVTDRHIREYGKIEAKTIENVCDDLYNPIPYTLLSNVLHVLCGEIPIPTKKVIGTNRVPKEYLKRVEVLDEIAKNSYVRFDVTENKVIGFDKENDKKTKFITSIGYNEMATSFKFHWNSTCKKDYYSWHYLELAFSDNKTLYNDFLKLLKQIIGVDKLPTSIQECVELCNKKCALLDDNTKTELIVPFKNLSISKWLNKFGLKNNAKSEKSSLVTYSGSKTPILNIKGVRYVLKLDGIIVCPIDNDEVIEKLYKGNGSARFLDSGIIEVIGLEKSFPYPNKETLFYKITDKIEMEQVVNEYNKKKGIVTTDNP